MLLSQENTIAEAAKQIGVTEQAYYRFRKQYGGMTETDAKKLKELEFELATNYSRYG